MPLGEEPITSYFPRLASGKPRQLSSTTKPRLRSVNETPAHGSSSNRKRPRKTTTRSLSSTSSGTPPPVWDLLGKTPKSKKARHDLNVTSSVISLDDDSDSDLHSGVVPSTNSTLTSESGNTKSGIRTTTGLVKGKQRLHVKPHVHDNTPNSKRYQSPTLDDLDNETTQRTVEILPDQVFLRDPAQSSQRSTPEGDRRCNSEVAPRSSDIISVTGNCSKDANHPSIHMVESSQTQNILLDYVSPHRPRILKRPPVTSVTNDSGKDNDNVEHIVQSSQTQCEIDFQGVHWRLDGLREPSRQPFRTLSDVLFSIPRRGASFTDHLVDDLPLQQCSESDATKELDPDMSVQEDSVTESDSDGEMLRLWANNTCTQDSHSPTDQTQTSFASDDIGSLPVAVKDFQEMFDTDESYPVLP